MQHIKLYESMEEDLKKIESYFKDKINWKFFNYLIDRATYIEDIGFFIRFSVVVFPDFDTNFTTVYTYRTKDNIGVYEDDASFEYYINAYENVGLIYRVTIWSYPNGVLTVDLKLTEDYFVKVSDKCVNYNYKLPGGSKLKSLFLVPK